jgi:hypothetical protein
MNRHGIGRLTVGFVVLVVLAMATSFIVAKEKKGEAANDKASKGFEYSAVILPPADSNNMTPSEIIIKIDRFTTPEERAALKGVLEKDGQSALLCFAQKTSVGRLIRAGGRGIDILYAAQEKTEKGDAIIIVCPRFPLYPNTVMNADEMKYPFGLAVLYPKAEEKGGDGVIVGVTSITMDAKGKVDVTGYKPSKANLAYVKAK